ncbi:MAG: sugar ABC transporter ATP-binding protein, partial [Clostridia bacterium]|nr:sugar ABC transporter ATP-binding protein [Clostridia bacterium]
ITEGEIFGIGGLAGQGKIGVPNGIMGLFESVGEVTLFGQKLALNDPAAALKAGMAFVSEDRRGVGLLLDESIEDNIVFSAIQVNREYLKLGQKDSAKIRAFAQKMISDLDIRCTSPAQPVGTLSGGNQQKVCVARALALHPRFMFIAEPTRGIDIGAKQLVLETLVKLNREQHMTIVMVSSELNELRSICDHIAIVAEGKVVDILKPNDSDTAFGLSMSGVKPERGLKNE